METFYTGRVENRYLVVVVCDAVGSEEEGESVAPVPMSLATYESYSVCDAKMKCRGSRGVEADSDTAARSLDAQ